MKVKFAQGTQETPRRGRMGRSYQYSLQDHDFFLINKVSILFLFTLKTVPTHPQLFKSSFQKQQQMMQCTMTHQQRAVTAFPPGAFASKSYSASVRFQTLCYFFLKISISAKENMLRMSKSSQIKSGIVQYLRTRSEETWFLD